MLITSSNDTHVERSLHSNKSFASGARLWTRTAHNRDCGLQQTRFRYTRLRQAHHLSYSRNATYRQRWLISAWRPKNQVEGKCLWLSGKFVFFVASTSMLPTYEPRYYHLIRFLTWLSLSRLSLHCCSTPCCPQYCAWNGKRQLKKD